MDQSYSEPMGQPWQYSKDYHQIADFLGVTIYDRNDSELHKKISALQEWGGGDTHKVLTEISKLRRELGVQFIGKPLVKELYQSVRLKQDGQRKNPEVGFVKSQPEKPKEVKKANPLQKIVNEAVSQTVQQSVSDMVKQTLADKKVVSTLVQDAVKGAMK